MKEYIYLIREREFIRLNENIYKIGKTQLEPNTRLNGYPKGSEVIVFLSVKNCSVMETTILNIFRKIFKNRTDIGSEYFEGNCDEMKKIIYNECKHESEQCKLDFPDNPIINILKDNKEKDQECFDYVNNDNEQYCKSEKKNIKYYCDLCKYQTNKANYWYTHKKSQKHQLLLKKDNDNKQYDKDEKIKNLENEKKILENKLIEKNYVEKKLQADIELLNLRMKKLEEDIENKSAFKFERNLTEKKIDYDIRIQNLQMKLEEEKEKNNQALLRDYELTKKIKKLRAKKEKYREINNNLSIRIFKEYKNMLDYHKKN